MTTETKWTPGPWRAYETAEGFWSVRDSENRRVATDLTEPMACLIAQSPAMYEALERAERPLRFADTPEGTMVHFNDLTDELSQVLAAADGRGE